jgi:hypothetical protein
MPRLRRVILGALPAPGSRRPAERAGLGREPGRYWVSRKGRNARFCTAMLDAAIRIFGQLASRAPTRLAGFRQFHFRLPVRRL